MNTYKTKLPYELEFESFVYVGDRQVEAGVTVTAVITENGAEITAVRPHDDGVYSDDVGDGDIESFKDEALEQYKQIKKEQENE